MHKCCNGCPVDGDCEYQLWNAPEECDIIVQHELGFEIISDDE